MFYIKTTDFERVPVIIHINLGIIRKPDGKKFGINKWIFFPETNITAASCCKQEKHYKLKKKT